LIYKERGVLTIRISRWYGASTWLTSLGKVLQLTANLTHLKLCFLIAG